MNAKDIFDRIDDQTLISGYSRDVDRLRLGGTNLKLTKVNYFADRHFEPADDGRVTSIVAPLSHPWHQGHVIELIAWPVNRPEKWVTCLKRAGLFSIRRLAPAFCGGCDPFFIYRTPQNLLRRCLPDYYYTEKKYLDEAFGAVMLSGDSDLRVDRVQTIVAEDEEHACELSERFGRPVCYRRDEFSNYLGESSIEHWLKCNVLTVSAELEEAVS